LCRDILTGRYYKHEKVGCFCSQCKDDSKQCQRCGVPSLSALEQGGMTWCRDCYNEAPTCHSCGDVLGRKSFSLDRWPDRRFCMECTHDAEKCDFCAQPVSGDGFTYPDGRVSCDECRATAVTDIAVALELEIQARQWMGKRLRWAMRPSPECPFHLVGADEIAEIQGKAFVATPGFDQRERGLFSVRTTTYRKGVEFMGDKHEFGIYLETGLPRAEAYGTAVHELVHLWQFDNYPKKPVHRQYMEGLACWAQYHALLDAGQSAHAERLLANPDPIYGGGLRMIKQMEDSVGFDALPGAVVVRVGGKWNR